MAGAAASGKLVRTRQLEVLLTVGAKGWLSATVSAGTDTTLWSQLFGPRNATETECNTRSSLTRGSRARTPRPITKLARLFTGQDQNSNSAHRYTFLIGYVAFICVPNTSAGANKLWHSFFCRLVRFLFGPARLSLFEKTFFNIRLSFLYHLVNLRSDFIFLNFPTGISISASTYL